MKQEKNSVNKNYYVIALGIMVSIILMVPYIILGEGSIVTYHDQLDGEMINYILAAKYLFKDVSVYPELMNGIPVTGAIPPAFLFVILYKLFSPYIAFLISQWIISVVGFLGMYLLAQKLCNNTFISFVISCVFMILPFYPVYGLCIPGQPMLVFCILQLIQKNKIKYQIGALVYVLIYSLSSSLILVGFVWEIAFVVVIGIHLFRNIFYKKKINYYIFAGFGVLTCGYLLTNLALIKQVFFPTEGMVSHKSELIHDSANFVTAFKEALYPGITYTRTWAWPLVILFIISIVGIIISMVRQQKAEISERKKSLILSLICFALCIILALGYAIYSSEPLVSILNKANGAVKSFNFGRIVWAMPTIIMITATFLLKSMLPQKNDNIKNADKVFIVVRYAMIVLILGIWSVVILYQSPLKANISKIVKRNNYYALDWKNFYSTDIYSQIKEEIGRPQDEYKVVSVGVYPAAALYNGFYTLDGYSNNYPLVYKKEFREVFEGELEKNDYIRGYYDNWGNRCYITTNEFLFYYCVEKKWNGGFHQLDINTEKLKEMGCEYIFAATYIINYEELNLKPIREEAFETEGSWYNIYVYQIQ